MTIFSIGLSALRSSQFALDVVSNNVTNANTDGYHRRRVGMETAIARDSGGFRIGSGVNIARISRIRDQVTEASLTTVISDSSEVDQLLSIERKIESAIVSGDNAVGRQLDQFFAEMTNLSASPHEPAQQSAVLESGRQLANALGDASQQLSYLKANLRLQINNEIENLNTDLEELSEVSLQVMKFSAQGAEHNNELDHRDEVLNRIAEVIGIRRTDDMSGQLHLAIGNHSIQQGSVANSFRLEETDGQVEVFLDDSQRPMDVSTGRLAALVDAYNSIIPSYEDKLDQVAANVIQDVNQVHATGIGTSGGFQNLVGTMGVEDSSVPLSDSLPTVDLSAGEITVSITDSAGERQTHTIAVDPEVDNLDDLATRLAAIPGLNALVRTPENSLQITTVSGNTFDFAGGIESQPDLALVTGTSAPSLSGVYTENANEDITVRIEGSGQVGSSPNLFANVFSSTGALLSRVNLGDGYEAGTEVELDDGVRMSFTVGTLNNNDEFTTRLTGNSDESGLLGALGMNGFFTGSDASTIAINDEVANTPGRIATGRSGEPSDTSNLIRFIALDDATNMPGNRTLSQFTSEIGTEIGFQVNSNTSLSASLTSFQLSLEQDRDAKSGVDLNEELVYLQEYQKSYEAAVRIIQAADDILNELFAIVR